MRRSCLALAALLTLSFAHGSARGDEGHHHDAVPVEKLGTVHFPVTAKAAVQRDFDRAVALLHSFQYEQAEEAFTKLAKANPSLGMAYWGIAMANYHPIWGPTTNVELERGRAAAEKAAKVGAKTDRERAYIAAVGAYYRDPALDFPSRKVEFEKAMESLHQKFPDDMEGTIFYALAILGTSPTTDRTYAKQRKAAELLNGVLPKAENHPGVAHYLIHSMDYPELASLALAAAKAYSKIAPSAPHALHMPSHIFTRLGLWDESIQSNLASAQAGHELAGKGQTSGYNEELHALDYLEYAYLQLGQDDRAKEVVDRVRALPKFEQPILSAAYAYAAAPARYALERRQWGEAAALTSSPEWFPWDRFRWAEAVTQFARGMGAARSGDLATARSALERLTALHESLVGQKEGYNWAEQVEIQKRAVAGWIARAETKNQDAERELRAAADLEDSIDKHPVTPGAVLPAREQLADLLIDLGRPADAAAEYETVLKSSPSRRNSLRGLEAAKKAAPPATDPSSTRRSQ